MRLVYLLSLKCLTKSSIVVHSVASHNFHREEELGHAAAAAKERNYWTVPLANKIMTSTEHIVTYLLLHDNECNLQRAWISLVTPSFCRGNNSMITAWPDPFSLCEGRGLRSSLYHASLLPPCTKTGRAFPSINIHHKGLWWVYNPLSHIFVHAEQETQDSWKTGHG